MEKKKLICVECPVGCEIEVTLDGKEIKDIKGNACPRGKRYAENELTKQAEVPLSDRTKGAIVYENRETLVDGIFACGNVLQVHDLVDFVSEESEIAGKAAARYLLQGTKEKEPITVKNGGNISYVLPQRIDRNCEENVKLFFRVTGTFRDAKIVLKSGEKVLLERKKRIVVPGEMETLLLLPKQIKEFGEELSVSLES